MLAILREGPEQDLRSRALAPFIGFSAVATTLGLFLLPLTVSIGPRFEFFSDLPSAHLRVQDFVIPIVFVSVLIALVIRPGGELVPRRLAKGVAVYALTVSLAAFVIILQFEETELLIRLGFLYRLAVLPVIAFLVYVGLRSQQTRGVLAVIGGFGIGTLLNFVWIYWQIAMGIQNEAWRFTSSDPWNWGVVTFGEGAPFPASQFLVVLLMVSLAGAVTVREPLLRFPLAWISVAVLLAIFLTGSRASVASATVISSVGLFLLLRTRILNSSVSRLVFWGGLAVSGLFLYFFLADRRFSIAGLTEEFTARSGIWNGHFEHTDGSALWGLGPGGLRVSSDAEAHNVFVYLAGDFGVIGLIFATAALLVLLFYSGQKFLQVGPTSRRFFALFLVFITTNTIISGLAQDSLNPVVSTHMLAILFGIGLWSGWGREEMPHKPFTTSRFPRLESIIKLLSKTL
jgi:O-antigen ligase